MTTLGKTSIERLNRRARYYAARDGSVYEALLAAAREALLTEVSRTDQAILFASPGGHLVNCWIEGPRSGICEGGAGFDDQVEDD